MREARCTRAPAGFGRRRCPRPRLRQRDPPGRAGLTGSLLAPVLSWARSHGQPMRICILSRNPTLYSTRRLRDAALARGDGVMVVDYLRCYVDSRARSPEVMYPGAALQKFDAIIPRVASSAEAAYGAAIVRQFE